MVRKHTRFNQWLVWLLRKSENCLTILSLLNIVCRPNRSKNQMVRMFEIWERDCEWIACELWTNLFANPRTSRFDQKVCQVISYLVCSCVGVLLEASSDDEMPNHRLVFSFPALLWLYWLSLQSGWYVSFVLKIQVFWPPRWSRRNRTDPLSFALVLKHLLFMIEWEILWYVRLMFRTVSRWVQGLILSIGCFFGCSVLWLSHLVRTSSKRL